MKVQIFPYQTLQGDVRLVLSGGGLDDGEWSKVPYTPDRRLVQLYNLDKEDWKRAEFKVQVQGPADEIAKFDKQGAEARCVAVLECSRTCYRQSIVLMRATSEPAKWVGTVEVERANFAGKASVHALIVGKTGSLDNRYLALSESWLVYFDPPDIPPLSGTMRVQWQDFDQPDEGLTFLTDFAEHSYYTDLQSETPTLYLNRSQRFDGLSALLDDRPRKPGERPLHNAERVSIARTVWMAMLHAAIASVGRDEDGVAEWPPEDWKRSVLKKLLSKVFPDKSQDELLEEAMQAWNSNDRAGQLESWVQAAIDRNIGAGKLLQRTLTFMNSNSQG